MANSYKPECLCESHAKARGYTPEVTVPHYSELPPDEFIECEDCEVAMMRRNGAL
jgi:hypothetical protein